MVNNFKILTLFIVIFLAATNLFSKNLTINGLSKLNFDDLQTQTSIDLSKKLYTDDEINILLKDLYKSDLIFDLQYKKDGQIHFLTIEENKIIENIFINGNKEIDEELITQNISSKKK